LNVEDFVKDIQKIIVLLFATALCDTVILPAASSSSEDFDAIDKLLQDHRVRVYPIPLVTQTYTVGSISPRPTVRGKRATQQSLSLNLAGLADSLDEGAIILEPRSVGLSRQNQPFIFPGDVTPPPTPSMAQLQTPFNFESDDKSPGQPTLPRCNAVSRMPGTIERKKEGSALVQLGRRWVDAETHVPVTSLTPVVVSAAHIVARCSEVERECLRDRLQKERNLGVCKWPVVPSTQLNKAGVGVASLQTIDTKSRLAKIYTWFEESLLTASQDQIGCVIKRLRTL
jgi:hypothetical protein